MLTFSGLEGVKGHPFDTDSETAIGSGLINHLIYG